MSDEVSVALNSDLGPAAPRPSDHFPIAEAAEAGQPNFGKTWAFLAFINLPAAPVDGNADRVDQAKQAITQFLKPVEENGSLHIVKSIGARFNRASLLQQAIEYCFSERLCPAG
jgi:hypothetical protein